MNFFPEQLVGAPKFRVFTLVDLYYRYYHALRAGFSLKGGDVTVLLEQFQQSGRKPENLTVDNGSEFTFKELDT